MNSVLKFFRRWCHTYLCLHFDWINTILLFPKYSDKLKNTWKSLAQSVKFIKDKRYGWITASVDAETAGIEAWFGEFIVENGIWLLWYISREYFFFRQFITRFALNVYSKDNKVLSGQWKYLKKKIYNRKFFFKYWERHFWPRKIFLKHLESHFWPRKLFFYKIKF